MIQNNGNFAFNGFFRFSDASLYCILRISRIDLRLVVSFPVRPDRGLSVGGGLVAALPLPQLMASSSAAAGAGAGGDPQTGSGSDGGG